MRQFLFDIDRLLRGGFTRPEDLRAGNISMPARTLLSGGVILGCIYGVFMGLYGATRPDNASVAQLFATTLKVPLLFLLTLAVTFPSLYVLSALAGSRLKFQQTMRLLLAAVAINLALLASLGPVVGFFTLSTQSYPFMIVLNVLIFGLSGLAGLFFLRRALMHVFASPEAGHPDASLVSGSQAGDGETTPESTDESATESATETVDEAKPNAPVPTAITPVPLPTSGRGLSVFRVWLVVYGVVGAQMGWVLRPFIGTPELPFSWFREREGNFLQGILEALTSLFS